MPQDIQRGMDAGFNHSLTKAVDVIRLLDCVDETLRLLPTED
ncbi:MAG: hypothetical protein ACI9FJ_001596 [Alteromonadaceae bacterium]|jgi:hypothetical protein